MKIATLTTTRGDRPQLFNFCKAQIDLQTVDPDFRYEIDYPAKAIVHDLVERFRVGISLAKANGADFICVFEDDDCYPTDYIEKIKPYLAANDFVGFDTTIYYNIKNKTWMHQTHPGRSSLFCTAFRLSALDDFIWPADNYLWLDIRLWEHARDKRKKVKLLNSNPAVGIKHGVGLCAGKSHYRRLEHNDNDMAFLKTLVEPFQLEFYKSLNL